jgi:hypothetical protein
MTSECNPPSASKRYLQAINILEEKHTQDMQRREGEFQARIDQLQSDAKQQQHAVISHGVEDGVSEEKDGEDRVERVKVIGLEGQSNLGVEVDDAMEGVEGKEIGAEEGKRIEDFEEERRRSEEIEELLRTELQHSDEEIRNLRYKISPYALLTTSYLISCHLISSYLINLSCQILLYYTVSSHLFQLLLYHVLHVLHSRLLGSAEERVDAQQRELLGREEEMAELRRECLREAIETSSQLGSMSTRLLALTAENVALKSRPRQQSKSVSVQEEEEVEEHGEGGAGGSIETYSVHNERRRDDGVRCDADSCHSSPASDKHTHSSNDMKRGIRDGSSDIDRATTHITTLHYMREHSTDGWNSDEKGVEVSAMHGAGAVRDSHNTASKNRHQDSSIRTKKDVIKRMGDGSGGSGGSSVATDSVSGEQRERGQQRVSGVEALSYQMTAMEMQVSQFYSILIIFYLDTAQYRVQHNTLLS